MKIKSILILTMAIVLFSCQEDDDIKNTNETELEININNLKGSWLAIEATENPGDGIGLLVKLIIFFLTIPLIGDEPLLAAGISSIAY